MTDQPKPEAPAQSQAEGNTADEQPAKLSPTQGEGGDEKKKEEGGGSEAMVRESYLPVNKLKDAPPAENYEGRKPEEFMHEKGPGLGAQISQGVHNLKEKVIHHKDK